MPEEQINVNVSVDDSVAVGIKAPEMINYTPVSVTVGTTTTLDAGESATVTNSGDQYDAVLNFGIPKGDKGDSGKSAYESAVDGGYTGTEAEFEQALASDIGTVAGIASDVTQVAGIASAVSNVAANESDVTLVSDNMASVMTTASNIGDISTVAGIASNVSTVAGDSANISAVAADLTNIDTAATNISAIIAAPTAATNAATSATNAQTWAEGTDAQVSALGGTKSSKGWAARAEELVQSIGQVMHYKGSVSTYADLTAIVDPELGDVYNVLADDSNYAWTGSAWDMIGSSVDLSAYRTAAAQDVIDAGKLGNTATGTNSLTILGTAATATGAINIGKNSKAQGNYGVAIGNEAWTSDPSTVAIGAQAKALDYYATAISGYGSASKMYSIALGYSAFASAKYAIQLGEGINSTINTMQVWTYPLLNKSTGKIPAARLTAMVGADGVNAGTAGAVPAPTATDNTKFLRGDGTWAEAGGGSVSSPTLTWYTGQTGTTLTILDTSAAVCVKVYKNGVLLQPTQDYSISGTTLTLTTALVATDKIIIEDSTMLDGSSLSNVVRSDDVAHIVKCTQAEYDALVLAGTVSSTTFYIIVN